MQDYDTPEYFINRIEEDLEDEDNLLLLDEDLKNNFIGMLRRIHSGKTYVHLLDDISLELFTSIENKVNNIITLEEFYNLFNNYYKLIEKLYKSNRDERDNLLEYSGVEGYLSSYLKLNQRAIETLSLKLDDHLKYFNRNRGIVEEHFNRNPNSNLNTYFYHRYSNYPNFYNWVQPHGASSREELIILMPLLVEFELTFENETNLYIAADHLNELLNDYYEKSFMDFSEVKVNYNNIVVNYIATMRRVLKTTDDMPLTWTLEFHQSLFKEHTLNVTNQYLKRVTE